MSGTPDREKVIKAIECCVANNTRCFDDNDKLCPYFSTKTIMCEIELLRDAIALLKEQDKRYAMMVVDWLRDMAHNNYLDASHMTFWDSILDIKERAYTGLENYFRDYDSDTKQQEGR